MPGALKLHDELERRFRNIRESNDVLRYQRIQNTLSASDVDVRAAMLLTRIRPRVRESSCEGIEAGILSSPAR